MPDRMDGLPPSVYARQARPVSGERFSLAYLWQALFLYPFRAQDLVTQLFVARFSSVLLNVGIVWLAFLTFCELLSSRRDLTALMTAMVVFVPQHTFINSTVGDGTLAELAACLVLYCWVLLFRRGMSAWRAAGIVLGTLVGIWSKNTATFLIPVDAGLAVWWFLRHPRGTWTRRHAAYLCAGVALLGLAVWIWGRSPLGLRALHYGRRFSFISEWAWTDQRGFTFGETLLFAYDSFWANFGWMALPIGERWYGAVALLSVTAIWGWCAGRPQEISAWSVEMMGGAAGVAVLIFIWVGLLSRQGEYYQYQGRYLFPVVIPFAFLLVGGLERLFLLRKNRAGTVLFLSSLVVLDTWCLAGYVLPFFYA